MVHIESGTACQIKDFSSGFSEKFVMFSPIKVNGSEAHPLFTYLKDKCPGFMFDAIKWNFTKVGFLNTWITLVSGQSQWNSCEKIWTK